MVLFVDGPAKHVNLLLRSAPLWLRVVQSRRTECFDALDQPDDEPTDGEIVFVYKRILNGGSCFVRAQSRAMSGAYAIAEYSHVPTALQADVRSAEGWRRFCREQKENE